MRWRCGTKVCYHHLRTSSSSSGQNSESHEDEEGSCGMKRLWSGSEGGRTLQSNVVGDIVADRTQPWGVLTLSTMQEQQRCAVLLGHEPTDAVFDSNLGEFGSGFPSAMLTLGVRDCRGTGNRSEAGARLGADAVPVLKRPRKVRGLRLLLWLA